MLREADRFLTVNKCTIKSGTMSVLAQSDGRSEYFIFLQALRYGIAPLVYRKYHILHVHFFDCLILRFDIAKWKTIPIEPYPNSVDMDEDFKQFKTYVSTTHWKRHRCVFITLVFWDIFIIKEIYWIRFLAIWNRNVHWKAVFAVYVDRIY